MHKNSKFWQELVKSVLLEKQPRLGDNFILQSQADNLSRSQYFVVNKARNIYFTVREAQCMVLLLRGFTYGEVAKYLKLSTRTIEYYVNNMKAKCSVGSRNALIRYITGSDFISHQHQVTLDEDQPAEKKMGLT